VRHGVIGEDQVPLPLVERLGERDRCVHPFVTGTVPGTAKLQHEQVRIFLGVLNNQNS
jgi:hypothetical protein